MNGIRRIRIRLGGVAALAVAAILAGGSVAAADSTSGLIGAYTVKDTVADPGARCNYQTGDGRSGASNIEVRAPHLWARNRTAGLDHQWVGWRVRLQQSSDYVHWYLVDTSATAKAQATDQTRASFSNIVMVVPFDTFARAKINMYWYRPGGSIVVQGQATHRVNHYVRYLDGTFEDNVGGSCPNDLPS